jgi:hypothetical protein
MKLNAVLYVAIALTPVVCVAQLLPAWYFVEPLKGAAK